MAVKAVSAETMVETAIWEKPLLLLVAAPVVPITQLALRLVVVGLLTVDQVVVPELVTFQRLETRQRDRDLLEETLLRTSLMVPVVVELEV